MIKLDMIQTVDFYSLDEAFHVVFRKFHPFYGSFLCCKWTNASFDGSGWERRGRVPPAAVAQPQWVSGHPQKFKLGCPTPPKKLTGNITRSAVGLLLA